MMSQVLTLSMPGPGGTILVQPDRDVPFGARLF
jgi:hypothetical protein